MLIQPGAQVSEAGIDHDRCDGRKESETRGDTQSSDDVEP